MLLPRGECKRSHRRRRRPEPHLRQHRRLRHGAVPRTSARREAQTASAAARLDRARIGSAASCYDGAWDNVGTPDDLATLDCSAAPLGLQGGHAMNATDNPLIEFSGLTRFRPHRPAHVTPGDRIADRAGARDRSSASRRRPTRHPGRASPSRSPIVARSPRPRVEHGASPQRRGEHARAARRLQRQPRRR